MSLNAKEILSPLENIDNYSIDIEAKMVPIKEVFKSMKKSEVKILKQGKTEVFKALKYILKSDLKVMKAQADSVSMKLKVEGDAVNISHENASQLFEMKVKLGVFSSAAFGSLFGKNSEESRIVKAWHDLIEEAEITDQKQLIVDFDNLLTDQWPCSIVGMYVSKYLKEPRHALKVFELLSGSVKQVFEKVKKSNKNLDGSSICENEFGQKQHNPNVNEEKKALRSSICNVAKDIFDSKRHLKMDILDVHEKKEPYQCSICEKAFCNEDLLKEHNAVVHEGIKAHKCSKCDGIFGSSCCLKKHISDVHDVKKAQISKKKKSKKKKNHLKVSEKVKKSNTMNLDGKKQYNCSICDCHFSYTAQCKL